MTNTKWTHHFLSADELNFIYKLGQDLNTIDHYCDSKPGIVSAANSFFIIDEETVAEYNLDAHTKPIIQKGLFVNGSVEFDERDYQKLVVSGKPTKILCFNDDDILSDDVLRYLSIGEKQKLHNRYKCLQRNNWYVIPNIAAASEGFFFKRSHHYPKLLKNSADILVTDSAYKIEMREQYNINHLIYSFYNSLTLTLAELYGRYYGGGVLELTPSEFKSLPTPHIPIAARQFATYTKDFENKTDIAEVIGNNDFHILNTSLNLNAEEVERIKSIYEKLIAKRFRKKSAQLIGEP